MDIRIQRAPETTPMYKEVKTLYSKGDNGRYTHEGYGTPDLIPGIWLINKLDNKTGSVECTNVGTKLGNIPGAADLELMVKCICLQKHIKEALRGALMQTLDGYINLQAVSEQIADSVYKELAKQQEGIETLVDHL